MTRERNVKTVVTACALIMALFTTSTLYAATATNSGTSVAPAPNTSMIPINFSNASGAFAGVFDINKFVVQNGTLNAVGVLTGTVTNAAGGVVGTVNQALTLPVLLPSSTGSCEILNLVLGPLDLNLLGLMVHLDQVVLNITAQAGPGNLLGNLLCAIAGLLNSGGPLQGLAGLLNNLLRVLG